MQKKRSFILKFFMDIMASQQNISKYVLKKLKMGGLP
jgi:hypothetical protein